MRMPHAETPWLAFVYDRHATTNPVVLEGRLQKCAQYAEAKGWTIGGWYLDEGTDALTSDQRPAFDSMLNTIRAVGADVPRVVLVHDWARLSRDDQARGLFTRKVLQLGAWVETCGGEQRTADGCYRRRGSLTAGPTTE
jgi:DNA invertase Pin-like site-specific DNA recombinase